MSLAAMTWALSGDAGTTNPTETIVLAVLAEHAEEDGSAAFPSLDRVAERAACSKSTVQRTLKVLETAEIIRRGDQSLAIAYARSRSRSDGVKYNSRNVPVVWNLAITGPTNPIRRLPEAERDLPELSTGQIDPATSLPAKASVDNDKDAGQPSGQKPTGQIDPSTQPVGSVTVDRSTVTSEPVLKSSLQNSNNTNSPAGKALAATAAGDDESEDSPAPQAAVAAPPRSAPMDDLETVRSVLRQIRSELPIATSQRLSPKPVMSRVQSLLRDGWLQEQILDRFKGQSWTNAGPGLVVSMLTGMVEEGPPAVALPTMKDDSRCEDHGIQGASSCSPCWSEVKTGEREAGDVGRLVSVKWKVTQRIGEGSLGSQSPIRPRGGRE